MRSIRGPVFYNRNRVARSGKMKKMLSVVKINMMLEPMAGSRRLRCLPVGTKLPRGQAGPQPLHRTLLEIT